METETPMTWLDRERALASAITLQRQLVGLENPYLKEYEWIVRASEKTGVYPMVSYARRICAEHYSWAVPTEEALEIVGATGKVVEIGAGGGYWTALLRNRGVEFHAYDTSPGKRPGSGFLWTHVAVGDEQAAGLYPDATLFICWPYMDSYANRALELYEAAGGQRVVYVGEWEGGCCTDEDFFSALRKWNNTATCAIPRWPGLNDFLYVYERS